ncbi:hypothetical protein WA026_007873, partial [Henosepilachna vigintioctopunctata]
DNKIELEWYQKVTNSTRYIHYWSYHPFSTKINFIREFKRRKKNICHLTRYEKNIQKFKHILQDNAYPSRLINKLLFISPNQEETHKKHKENNTKELKISVLPYVTTYCRIDEAFS